ncbi:MAG TPA: hypothetical protein VIO16_08950, partial [Dehalococcoidia bacterium]
MGVHEAVATRAQRRRIEVTRHQSDEPRAVANANLAGEGADLRRTTKQEGRRLHRGGVHPVAAAVGVPGGQGDHCPDRPLQPRLELDLGAVGFQRLPLGRAGDHHVAAKGVGDQLAAFVLGVRSF